MLLRELPAGAWITMDENRNSGTGGSVTPCCAMTKKHQPCTIGADRERAGKWYCHVHDPEGTYQKQVRGENDPTCRTFVCASCGETLPLDDDWADGDAVAEYEAAFHQKPEPTKDAEVCGPCYKAAMGLN